MSKLFFLFLLSASIFVSADNLTSQGLFGQVWTRTESGKNVCVSNADLKVVIIDNFGTREIANATTDEEGRYFVPLPDYGFYKIAVNGIYNLTEYPIKRGERDLYNRELIGCSGTKYVGRGKIVKNDFFVGLIENNHNFREINHENDQGFYGRVYSRTEAEDLVCVVNAKLEIFSFDGRKIISTTTDEKGEYKIFIPKKGFYIVNVGGKCKLEKHPYKRLNESVTEKYAVSGDSGTKYIGPGEWVQNDFTVRGKKDLTFF